MFDMQAFTIGNGTLSQLDQDEILDVEVHVLK